MYLCAMDAGLRPFDVHGFDMDTVLKASM